MKKIKLTQGQYAIVDDADYEELSKHKWCAKYSKCTNSFYAVRMSFVKKSKRLVISMAREILGLKYKDKRQADHQNHNTLDNRQDNLRICTAQQNHMNRKSLPNSSSRFKGVSWHKLAKKWSAQIFVNKKLRFLGYFDVEIFAALAYNVAARKYFGEFACLNLI